MSGGHKLTKQGPVPKLSTENNGSTSGHDFEMLVSKNKNNFPNLQVSMFDNVHFMKPELMLVKLGTKTNGKKITCEKDTFDFFLLQPMLGLQYRNEYCNIQLLL